MCFPGFHSRIAGVIERKQVAECGGFGGAGGWTWRGGAIVINAADAALRSASGQCSHFQKSPLNSLQIPTGFRNPFKSSCNFSYFFPFRPPPIPLHSSPPTITSSLTPSPTVSDTTLFPRHRFLLPQPEKFYPSVPGNLRSPFLLYFFIPAPPTPTPTHLFFVDRQTNGVCLCCHSGRKPGFL